MLAVRVSFWLVWVCSCRAALLFPLDLIVQIEHGYGFSPVWVDSCSATLRFTLNRFKINATRSMQMVPQYHLGVGLGFPPLW